MKWPLTEEEQWCSDTMRWRIELFFKCIAIVAPFIILYLSIRQQAGSQRAYEAEKTSQLTYAIVRELELNLTDIETDWIARPVLSESLGTSVTGAKFSSEIWVLATSRDYFFLIDDSLYYELKYAYDALHKFNLKIDLLTGLGKFIEKGSREDQQYRFNLRASQYWFDAVKQRLPITISNVKLHLERMKR